MSRPGAANRRRARWVAGFLATAALGACTVGPDYIKPVAVVPAAYKESQPWKLAEPGDGVRLGAWWRIFNDPQLNDLEDQVSAANQTVIAAEAHFREARTLVDAARAGSFPQVNGAAAITRSYAKKAGGGGIATSYSLAADASWELDLWGRIRRGVEASQAAADASAADLEAAKLSMHAELASDVFQLRAVDSQIRLLERTAQAYRATLKLSRTLNAAGMTSAADVLLAETQVSATEAQAIDLGVQRAQLEHAIAVLTGQPPAGFGLAQTSAESAPPRIPLSQPSELLERRPDIAAAERLVAAANAQIGVAKAAYFPAVTLSATAGFASSAFASWLSLPSRVWSLGTAVTQTIFDGGLRGAQVAGAEANYDATVADYRQTVLNGFMDVENNLAALRILETEAQVQEAALLASRQSFALTSNLYNAGMVSYLAVIVVQTVAFNNERTAVDIAGRRMVASVLLIRALGGVWETAR